MQAGNVFSGLITDVELGVKPEELGDVLMIFLSQTADSVASWKIQVWCRTDQGMAIAGQVICLPPGAGEPPSRIVACAYVPGAKGWKVSCSTTSPKEQAFVKLASSKQGGAGLLPGVTPAKNGTQNPGGNLVPADTSGAVMQAGPVQVAGAVAGSTLFWADGNLRTAQVAAGNSFIMLFDQPAAPVNGQVPFWSQHVGGPAVAGATPDPSHWGPYAPPGGRLIQNQLWAITSSTPDVLTIDLVNTTSLHAVIGTRP